MATQRYQVWIEDPDGGRYYGTVEKQEQESPAAVDCVLSEWGEWGPWENDGEPGEPVGGFYSQDQKRTRTRTVLVAPENGGEPCGPLEDEETRTIQVPVDPSPGDIVFTQTGSGETRGQAISGTPNLPAVVWLHATGSVAQNVPTWGDLWEYDWPESLANYPDPGDSLHGKFTVEENSGLIRIRPADHIINPRNGQVWPLWWIGIVENGVANKFVHQRLDAIIEFCIEHYSLDPNRIYIAGVSLGGRGTVHYGLRRNYFAAMHPMLPDWNIARIPDLETGSKVTLYPTPVVNPDQTDYYPDVDMVSYLADPANPSPWIQWNIGQYDDAATWEQQLQVLDIMRQTRRAHAFCWNGGDHSGSTPCQFALEADYPLTKFAKDKSHPAFFNSSIDDDPTVMLPPRAPGDNTVWGVNLGFDWRNVVDTEEEWSCEITNTRAEGDMTVDVMPYNCQTFATVVDPKPVTIPHGQWVSVTFTAEDEGELPPPVDPPPPPVGDDFVPTIYTEPSNSAALVMLTTYHTVSSERYDRFQKLVEINTTTYTFNFWKRNLKNETGGGGSKVPFSLTEYTLRIDGNVLATTEVAEGASEGSFADVDLSEITPGWHKFSIDVDLATETSPPWFIYYNPEGGPVSQWVTTPACTGSYELSHESAYFSTELPARYTPTELPLTPRECPEFDTAVNRTLLHRETICPLRHENINRPSVNTNGVMGTFNKQSYFWSDVIAKYPRVHLLDGPRGVGTVVMPTHMMLDRHGGVYGCDPWRVFRVFPDGTVKTRAGWRHKQPPINYDSLAANELDLVGDWSAIPPERHGFHEPWGLAFDLNSLGLDEGAETILNPINGELEHPHSTAPRLFVSDTQNNRIVLLTFSPDDFDAEPVVTEFITGMSDPWDVIWHDDKLYVSERTAHRISVWDATDGSFIETLVQGSALAYLDSVRIPRLNPGVNLATAQAAVMVAPEGLFLQDGWLYWGSYITRQIKKINLSNTDEIEVAWTVPMATQSRFVKFVLSDGTFGPRGTVFHATWGNTEFGMPYAQLPNGTRWTYNTGGHINRGKGGAWKSLGYGHASAVGMGRLYSGSSEEGLTMVSLALPSDPAVDVTKYRAGLDAYEAAGYRIAYGDYGYGFQGLALPWGESSDMDYFLECEGHTPPAAETVEPFDINTLSKGEIRRVPGTKLVDALQANGRKVIEWLNDPVTGQPQQWPHGAGNVREKSIMLAESGAAVSLARKEIYHCGGGHQDGAHFGLYGFKFALPGDTPSSSDWKWRRVISHPQLFEGEPNYPHISTASGTTYNPDGSPVSRHTWGGICFVDHLDIVWVASGSTWPLGHADPQRLSWHGQIANNVWVEGPPVTPVVVVQMFSSNYSPTLEKVFWTSEHTIYMHDPVTGEDRPINNFDGFQAQSHSVLDDVNQKLYVFHWNPISLKVFDLTQIDPDPETPRTSLPSSAALDPDGDLTALSHYRPGSAWSKNHGHVMWVGGNDIYVAPLPNATYTKYTLTGDEGPAMVAQGMFGKFSFIDPDGEYAIINTSVNEDAFVFRMPETS